MSQPNEKRTDRVGEILTNSRGSKYKIIEYRNANDITIQFLDEHGYITRTGYGWNPKNPYDKTVCGVGYIGVMSNGTVPKTSKTINGKTKHTKEYIAWYNMINRCYNDKIHLKKPRYKDCYVDEPLKSFAYFLEHVHEIDGYDLLNTEQRVELDKDIKYPGNLCYSIKTCKFVPQCENAREVCVRTDFPSKGNNWAKSVKCTNIETEEVITLKSLAEARKFLKVGQGTLNKCLSGEINEIKGYKVELN